MTSAWSVSLSGRRLPFEFHLAVDTLPSSILIEASEALPPVLATSLVHTI